MIALTEKQEKGLDLAVQRYINGERITVIAGFAGTGKSTLVQFIVAALGIPSDKVVYAAYAGKAALVLKRKGCPNAMTLHRLIYKSVRTGNGKFTHIPKASLDRPYKLIIVDEISMVPDNMMQLLLKFNVHIIALGDPFQLPSFSKDNGLLKNPHVFLTEIMRQSADNEIIDFSFKLRESKPIEIFKGNDLQILNKSAVVDGMYTWADQIICATNKTRFDINNVVREMQGRGKEIEDGDKMICLSNYWGEINELGDALVNGTTGIVSNISIKFDHDLGENRIHCDFTPDFYDEVDMFLGDVVYRDITLDHKLLHTNVASFDWDNLKNYPLRIRRDLDNFIPKEFAFGHAITCHKSQGSEYSKVLLIEEGFPFPKKEHYRWCYTGATRASEKLVVIKK